MIVTTPTNPLAAANLPRMAFQRTATDRNRRCPGRSLQNPLV